MDVLGDEGEWMIDVTGDAASVVINKAALREGIASLSECQREVLVSVYVTGISIAEYAEIKGIGLSTAYFNLDRAKNNLKNFLEA